MKPAAKAVAKKVAARSTLHAPRSRAKAKRKGVPPDVVYRVLSETFPDAHCELDFTNAFELLCATILSAQCTDKRVNMVTPTLFARYPNAAALADADQETLEEIIKSTGFYRNKAKSLKAMSRALVEQHGGEVPRTMGELVVLPGVGRKTANVILGNAFGINEGITVDTHVLRVASRLGLSLEVDAVKMEEALMPLFPREQWTMLSHLLIFHGRRICDAKKPKCGECPLVALCPSAMV